MNNKYKYYLFYVAVFFFSAMLLFGAYFFNYLYSEMANSFVAMWVELCALTPLFTMNYFIQLNKGRRFYPPYKSYLVVPLSYSGIAWQFLARFLQWWYTWFVVLVFALPMALSDMPIKSFFVALAVFLFILGSTFACFIVFWRYDYREKFINRYSSIFFFPIYSLSLINNFGFQALVILIAAQITLTLIATLIVNVLQRKV